MKEKIKELLEEVEGFKAEKKEQVEDFRINFLGSKGKIKGLFADFKNVPNEQSWAIN
jgi:phenylalanyl-tRNA synthetase alpha chain